MEQILIIDFGSQYTQLIARRVRESGVYCEIMPFDVAAEFIREFKPQGIILSGGPESVTEENSPRAPEIVFQLGCPVLGVCYGLQTIVTQLGGQVTAGIQRELGYAETKVDINSQLFSGLKDVGTICYSDDLQNSLHVVDSAVKPRNDVDFSPTDAERLERDVERLFKINVWMSHGDIVTEIPAGFVAIAKTAATEFAAIENSAKNIYGLQVHPEVTHTEFGKEILENFLINICKCERSWTTANIITHSIVDIKDRVGSDKVILGLSGGVDSSVVAMLLHKAIGEQLICVFVDTGLLRLNESAEVEATFKRHFGLNLIVVDAKERFYRVLEGVTDPEEKRKIIGNEFVEVFQDEANKLTDVKWLAQGTIYPDVVESARTKHGKSQVIKSHHNVGGLPEKLHLKIIEPIRELFKDEVRKVGLELALAQELISRHPFPGPGLGVRILGAIKAEYVDILQQADAIFIEELINENLYHDVSQAFATFLPLKTVAVVGDARCYDYIVALRAVRTTDFMTAQWADLPAAFLAKVSKRILNEVQHVSRVLYDISDKPPATIEWE